MTPEQIRAAVASLGIPKAALSAMLGYGHPSRLSEIMSGKKTAGASVVRLLQAYLDGYRPNDWPNSNQEEQ